MQQMRKMFIEKNVQIENDDGDKLDMIRTTTYRYLQNDRIDGDYVCTYTCASDGGHYAQTITTLDNGRLIKERHTGGSIAKVIHN